jgi:hypothetical protein
LWTYIQVSAKIALIGVGEGHNFQQ